MILTIKEVQQLTRAKHKSKMKRCLKQLGIRFGVDVDGYPVVLRERVFERLSNSNSYKPQEPNYSGLDLINSSSNKKRYCRPEAEDQRVESAGLSEK